MLMVTTLFRDFSNKREYLARILGRIGIFGLLERVAVMAGPALVVLTYHRIAKVGVDQFYDPIISATPDSFRAQIDWLRNRTQILTLKELDARVQNGGPWKEPAAFVTFDDGYRDNFDMAVPILRELRVPATFFIPTEFVESPKLPWWDYVAYVIKKTQKRFFKLRRNRTGDQAPISIDLSQFSQGDTIRAIIRAFLDKTIADEPWFLEQLAESAEVAVEEQILGRELFMSWDQVRQLAGSELGLSIGSHTHSHRQLARLDEQSQRHELALSKQILESHLGHEIQSLAYPYGWPGTYDNATKFIVREMGYRLAFSSRPGVNRPGSLDAYEINRIGVGSSNTLVLLRARTALFSALGRSLL